MSDREEWAKAIVAVVRLSWYVILLGAVCGFGVELRRIGDLLEAML